MLQVIARRPDGSPSAVTGQYVDMRMARMHFDRATALARSEQPELESQSLPRFHAAVAAVASGYAREHTAGARFKAMADSGLRVERLLRSFDVLGYLFGRRYEGGYAYQG